MSGPCRLTYQIDSWPLFFGRVGEARTMKCWSREDGLRILDQKSRRDGFTFSVRRFASPPTQPFEYEVLSKKDGSTIVKTVNRRSRRDALRWAAHVNSLFGSTHRYRILKSKRVAPVEPLSFIASSTPLMPPGNSTPADGAIRQAVAADPAAFLPAPEEYRAKPLPEIFAGDTIIARLTVTHSGVPAPAVCGVKIGNEVIGFEAADIIDVIKRAPGPGDKAIFDGRQSVVVDFIKGDFAMVSPAFGSQPFIAKVSALRAA